MKPGASVARRSRVKPAAEAITRSVELQSDTELSHAEPEVRIHLPPADSLGLAQTRPLQVEKPAVPRGCALAEVGGDTKYCRKCANRRCYLCRAIFQYRSVADVVRGIPGSLPRRSWRWAQIKQSRAASAARARLAADVSGRAACLP
jgi:hypothetical protein